MTFPEEIELKRATNPAPPPEDDIDVFTLPVHPWAAMFPMHSEDELSDLADDIKANGLRYPVVLGMTVTAEGFPAHLAVIDGRNRLAACKRAGVKPETITLNGEDQDAYIASVNLKRRNMNKGQQAMLIAARFPSERKGGRGKTLATNAAESAGLSERRLRQARSVRNYCPEMVEQIISGLLGLDEAYGEAERRRATSQSNDARYETLRKTDPDLADQVNEERLKLNEAEAAARARREEEESKLRSHTQTIHDISRYIGTFGQPAIDEVGRLYASNPERFHTDDLVGELDVWIAKATALKESINGQAEKK